MNFASYDNMEDIMTAVKSAIAAGGGGQTLAVYNYANFQPSTFEAGDIIDIHLDGSIGFSGGVTEQSVNTTTGAVTSGSTSFSPTVDLTIRVTIPFIPVSSPTFYDVPISIFYNWKRYSGKGMLSINASTKEIRLMIPDAALYHEPESSDLSGTMDTRYYLQFSSGVCYLSNIAAGQSAISIARYE